MIADFYRKLRGVIRGEEEADFHTLTGTNNICAIYDHTIQCPALGGGHQLSIVRCVTRLDVASSELEVYIRR